MGEGGGHDGKETCHDKGFSEGNNLSSLELGRFALSRKFRHFFLFSRKAKFSLQFYLKSRKRRIQTKNYFENTEINSFA